MAKLGRSDRLTSVEKNYSRATKLKKLELRIVQLKQRQRDSWRDIYALDKRSERLAKRDAQIASQLATAVRQYEQLAKDPV